MRKLYWAILIIFFLLLPAAWYLLSPLFIVIEADDPAPQIINDSLDSMDAKTRNAFIQQVESMKDSGTEMHEIMPTGARITQQGGFKPRAHKVAGNALVIEENGKKILRFEDFDTINGPNLHIYLSTDLGTNDFIDLGVIKATKGNVNYELPDDIDIDRYNKVLVWCVPFRVLFSYADLT